MPEHYFTQTSDGFEPLPEARGPWAADMLHGRLLGGLAAHVLERDHGRPQWRAARLTVDLFRPAAMEPVQVQTSLVREGRKVLVADAVMTCGGHTVGRTTAVFLPETQEPPGNIWRPQPSQWPDPDTVPPPADRQSGPDDEMGWLFRTVEGGFSTGQRSRVWTKDTVDLVEGVPMSPLVRAAVSGDIACPLSNSSDQGLYYINADYTMLIGRYPDGDWVGVEVDTQIAADGISVASATLVDRLGPFATSGGTSIARPPLVHDEAQ